MRTDLTRNTQDGQFRFPVTDDHEIYFRVATSPVIWGEKAVLRLLDKTGLNFDLNQMGYSGHGLELIRKAIELPNGMILTSGPTGSGKTTSMYALLNRINQEGINIVTLENPVEYKIDGINQIEVNPAIGLTFEAGLRSVLRQDPDVILVGGDSRPGNGQPGRPSSDDRAPGFEYHPHQLGGRHPAPVGQHGRRAVFNFEHCPTGYRSAASEAYQPRTRYD